MSETVYLKFPDHSLHSFDFENYENKKASTILSRLNRFETFVNFFGIYKTDRPTCCLAYDDENDSIQVKPDLLVSILRPVGLSESRPFHVRFPLNARYRPWFEMPLPPLSFRNPPTDPPITKNKNTDENILKSMLKVESWANFCDCALEYVDALCKDQNTFIPTPNYVGFYVSDEVGGLQPFLKANALDRCKLLPITGLEIYGGLYKKGLENVPDYFIAKGTDPVACVEVKGRWAFEWTCLLRQWNAANENAVSAIYQLFCQMRESNLYYGILTSYECWCFIARRTVADQESLYFSPVFTLKTAGPNAVEALAYFCNIATKTPPKERDIETEDVNKKRKSRDDDGDDTFRTRKKPDYYNPAGSNTAGGKSTGITMNIGANRSNPGTTDHTVESPSSSETSDPSALQEVPLIDCKVLKLITEMNAKIYLADYKNEQIVIKTIDPKNESFFEEMKHEIEVYLALSALQGDAIPELRFYGWMSDGRYALGLSNCGSFPEWTTENKHKALDVLERFHHAGYIHEDIKPDQFVVREDGRMFLLDFGRSRPVKTEADVATLHFEDRKLAHLLSL